MHSGLLFYSTAAQIIPVLLLVIALERRFFRPAGGSKPAGYAIDLVLSAVGLLLIGWAELGALQALDRGHGTDTARTNVYVALGVEAFFIFLLALGWTPRSERSQQHESDSG
jgi:hypothetical protein